MMKQKYYDFLRSRGSLASRMAFILPVTHGTAVIVTLVINFALGYHPVLNALVGILFGYIATLVAMVINGDTEPWGQM